MENEKKGFFHRTGEALGFIAPAPTVQKRQQSDGTPSPGVIPPAPGGLTYVSVDQALSIPAVYRAVSTIVSSVAQMDLGVYRGGIEIDTPSLIKQPNLDKSRRGFIKETVWSLATHGNAYWRVYGNPVASLEVLDPDSVSMVVENGVTRYWVGGEEVPTKNIRHLSLERRPGALQGMGPIQRGQGKLLSAFRLKSFADEWFTTSGVPTGILTTDAQLNAEEAAMFAEAWKAFLTKHGGTAVLSNGLHYEHLGVKPAEAQYLEVQQAMTVEIARLFGVPATMLASGNEGASNTYMNSQELWMQFLQTTLVDYMNEIEDAFSSLLPRGQEVNFKEDTLLRMNTVMETDVAVAQVNARLITPNEWRAAKGLPALPGGDTFPNTNTGSESNGTDA